MFVLSGKMLRICVMEAECARNGKPFPLTDDTSLGPCARQTRLSRQMIRLYHGFDH